MLCFDEELLRLTLRGAVNQAKKGQRVQTKGKKGEGIKGRVRACSRLISAAPESVVTCA